MLNTNLATAVAFLTWVGCDYATKRKPSLLGSVNGMIVGLVAITPAAGFVNGWGAMAIGVIASILVYVAYNYVALLRPFRSVDDTLGVVYTHGFAGLFGGLLTGLLADSAMQIVPGVSVTGGLHLLKWQAIAAAWVIVFSGVVDVHPAEVRGPRRPATDERGGHGDGRSRRPRPRGVSVRHPVARVPVRHPGRRARGSRRRGDGTGHVTTIIVSYDGTDNDRDALALGRLLAGAGASLELAYVSHRRSESVRTSRATSRSTSSTSASTANGLRDLAVSLGAELIVFGSEYRTAKGHVDPQATARRLLEGGPVALAFAPAGFADERPLGRRRSPRSARTATRARARRPRRSPASSARRSRNGRARDADLVVVGSKPGTVDGRVTISAAAEYLIELARLPRARPAARRRGRLRFELMPAESARLRRRVERRDLRLIAAAGVLGIAAVPLGLALPQQPASPARLRLRQPGRLHGQPDRNTLRARRRRRLIGASSMVGVASERLNRRTPRGSSVHLARVSSPMPRPTSLLNPISLVFAAPRKPTR